MALLEENKILDRASEDLPTTEEIGERRRAGRGMERPELAILVAFAKRLLARALEASDFVEEPWLERDLREYFPAEVVKRFGHLLADHPLKRQLICMVNSNQVVNSLGPTFVSQLMAERGAEPADIVRAFRIARAVTGADARWEVVERLEGVDKIPQLELMGGVDSLVEETTRWYLTWEPDADIEETIAAGRDGFERLSRPRSASSAPTSAGAGVSRARSGWSPSACRSRSRARTPCAPSSATRPTWCGSRAPPGRAIEEVADVFFASAPSCAWTGSRPSSSASPRRSRMQRWALQAVREDAAQVRRELAGGVLAESDDAGSAGGGRALPGRARRRAAPLHRLPALALARGRAGPRRPHARRPPAARARPKSPNFGRGRGLSRHAPHPVCPSCSRPLLLLAAARGRERPAAALRHAGPGRHGLRHRRQLPHAAARRPSAPLRGLRPGQRPPQRARGLHVPRRQRQRRALPEDLRLARAGRRHRADRRLPDRRALPDHRDRQARDALGELRDPRGDRGGRDAARRRRRLRRRDARRPRRRAAASTRTASTPPGSPTARAWPRGWRSTAPRRSPRSRSPAAGCRPCSRRPRPVPTYSTLGSLDDRVLAKQDPPLPELPLNPRRILANPVLGAHLDVALADARARPPPDRDGRHAARRRRSAGARCCASR